MFTLWAIGLPLLNVLLAAASSEHRVIPVDQLVQSLAISHDGKLVATVGIKQGGHPIRVVAVRDVATGKLERSSSEHRLVFPYLVAFSKDGKRVVAARVTEKEEVRQHHVYSLDLATGKEETIFNAEGYGGCLALLGDKLTVVFRALGKDPTVPVRDLITGAKADLKGHQLPCQSAAISADGKTVATWDERAIKVWDFPSGKERYHLPATSPSGRLPLSLSADGKLLAYTAVEPKPFLWDITPGQKTPKRLKTPAYDVWETIPIVYRFGVMCFSPDGRYLAVKVSVHDESFKDFRERQRGAETIELWSLPDGRRVATLRAPSLVRAGLGLRHVAFSGDGRWLAAAGSSGHVHVWRVPAR
jgi:WD40 repeat protein